jgi:hypothetical protein
MDRVDFTSPDGELTSLRSPEAVLALMQSKGGSYWNSHHDTGFATLSIVHNGRETARLVFTMKDGHGFHMKFTDCSSTSGLVGGYIASESDDYDTVVEVNLSDSPILLPQAYFVPLHLAEHVVQEVFRSGTRTSKVAWLDERKLDWDIQEGRRVS